MTLRFMDRSRRRGPAGGAVLVTSDTSFPFVHCQAAESSFNLLALMHPLLILLVGMATILVGIVVLRLNAFLALITAAIVVSLLAPGEAGVKIARVAEGFGRTAGTIGIVIALAGIAGKAMMDSGAADRIVRAFLALLGEKRGATALCATGYVLSIPVFFDTVFYLLVPLARSLHVRTGPT